MDVIGCSVVIDGREEEINCMGAVAGESVSVSLWRRWGEGRHVSPRVSPSLVLSLEVLLFSCRGCMEPSVVRFLWLAAHRQET